jgi:F0F1-type ATP synthase epsilon subunit
LEAKKLVIDISTGEEKVVDYEPEELAEYLADSKEEAAKHAARQAEKEARKAEQSAKAAAKQAAQEKLKALGLSPEEIAAITGA